MRHLNGEELKRYWELVHNPHKTWAEFQEWVELQGKIDELNERIGK